MSTQTRPEISTYTQRLDANWELALSEGSRFFEERSAVQDTLRKLAKRLGDLGIPYAIAGGMALFRHGYRRFTEDIDLLVTRESLKTIHDQLEGRGYVPPFTGSKNLRDTEHGVRIEFLITGEYPGDGKPKPVAFPDPRQAGVDLGDATYLNLPTLIELKLASGLTGGISRMKDFTDVVALIQALKLPVDLAEQLNPYVREKFLELWHGSQEPQGDY